ncbi:cyanidin 3-O-glucoside 5-O-glucosyltransferase (acyl-glucose)-like [Manihot esculenta]|uniref:cyanidin 3-O-glucoside 5-O-glucosyltransferase (acyl-glucose)-like n=1 Tax=Manihot esculenta TaxID=3983 RepID=UPI000B5D2F90|nr:cyanidin 3-O-glucoside 5-O-glucosyltransferase (acyl-glucose)-like [Manihot esculenta]
MAILLSTFTKMGNGLDELHPWKIVQGSDICMVILGVFLTLSDMLELMGGCEPCFGLYHVDIDDPQLKRHEKLSAHWYSHFLKGSPVGSAGQHFSPFLSATSQSS